MAYSCNPYCERYSSCKLTRVRRAQRRLIGHDRRNHRTEGRAAAAMLCVCVLFVCCVCVCCVGVGHTVEASVFLKLYGHSQLPESKLTIENHENKSVRKMLLWPNTHEGIS